MRINTPKSRQMNKASMSFAFILPIKEIKSITQRTMLMMK